MQSEPVARPRSRFGRFFAFGVLFEMLLLAFIAFMPRSNLTIEITNFVIVTHFPLIASAGMDMADGPVGALLLVGAGFLFMALIWGFGFFQIARLIGWLRTRLTRVQELAIGCVGLVGALVALAGAAVSLLPQTPIPFASSPEIKAVVDGNNAFALDLYQKLRGQPGNLFFSPFSISSALAMTSAGARGQTELEMTNALHFPLPVAQVHPAFRALSARMDRIQRWQRIILQCANSLWCQQGHEFTPDFLKVIQENYSAVAKPLDFKDSPGAAAAEINRWIAAKTSRKLPGSLQPDQLHPDTRLVLCDVIYFKGKWQNQFKEKDTKPAPFHVTTNETVNVSMMHQSAEVKYAMSEDDSVELLELPYAGRDLSMVILLPTRVERVRDAEHNDVFDLEQKLTADNLRAWLASLDRASPHKTNIGLPRFITTSHFALKHDLRALGIASAFDDTADFSGLDGTRQLFVSDVLHQAFVEVNEAGTEAAAMTLVLARTKGMTGYFNADHPFIFLIRENGSGTILFLGRIIDPTK